MGKGIKIELTEIAKEVLDARERYTPKCEEVSRRPVELSEVIRAMLDLRDPKEKPLIASVDDVATYSRALYSPRYYRDKDDKWFVDKLLVRVQTRFKDLLSFR